MLFFFLLLDELSEALDAEGRNFDALEVWNTFGTAALREVVTLHDDYSPLSNGSPRVFAW